MARTSTRTFRVVPGNTQQWDRFLTDFLLGLTDVEATSLADMQALSVMGRAINSAGQPADIVASSDLTLLRRSGTSLGFGTISSAYVSDFTEASQDITGALIQNGTGITWSYNDGAGTLTGTVSLASFSTTNLSEGANLYFTDERAQDAVGTILTDTSTIDLTYTDATPSITAAVIADSISNTLLANMAQSTIKGRAAAAGTGDPTDLTATQAATIVGSSFPSGDATTPGVAPAANPDTGIYWPANAIGISVDAGETALCNASKQWRFGGGAQGSLEAATSNTRVIASNASACYIEAYDGTRSAIFGVDAGGIECGAFSNHALNFRTNNTNRVTIDTSGNLVILTAGTGIQIKEGSNARMGASTLVAGTVTVSNTSVTANTRIQLTGQNSSGTHGELTVSARVAGTSFTITSASGTDTRLVAWELKEPAP